MPPWLLARRAKDFAFPGQRYDEIHPVRRTFPREMAGNPTLDGNDFC